MQRRALFFATLAAACCFALQCGYHLRGTGSSLPPHIKRMSVPMFKNNTTRYELDLKLTQGVINELVARGKVEVIQDQEKADAVLLGEIVSFTANPLAFTGEATADRYNITVVAKITLRDLVNQKVLFSNPYFVYIEEYEVPQGTDYESLQTQAINKVADKFARSLVVNILEGF
jgi:outer membrane lipopolysaccharide assembly protein LptE/RlpB